MGSYLDRAATDEKPTWLQRKTKTNFEMTEKMEGKLLSKP